VTAVAESALTALQTDMVHLVISDHIVVSGTGTSTQLISLCFHISAYQSVIFVDCEVLHLMRKSMTHKQEMQRYI
jgi:hypothetical protein